MSGETGPVWKQALVELTVGRSAAQLRVFVTEITHEFILGLDVLLVYKMPLDLVATNYFFCIAMVSDKVTTARCKRVVRAW